MRSVLVAAALVLVTLGNGLAQQADGPRDLAKRFFTTLGSAGPDVAYDELFRGSPLIEVQPLQVAALKQQTAGALSLFGTPLGPELVSETRIGDSVLRLNYLLKFDKHPVAWTFYFYRPRDPWFVSAVTFNDKFAFPVGP